MRRLAREREDVLYILAIARNAGTPIKDLIVFGISMFLIELFDSSARLIWKQPVFFQ